LAYGGLPDKTAGDPSWDPGQRIGIGRWASRQAPKCRMANSPGNDCLQ
jgi:hypothetical protein